MRRALALVLAAAVAAGGQTMGQAQEVPTCKPDGPVVEMTGFAVADDEGTYLLLPVKVARGTTRLEVGYTWTDLNAMESQGPLGGSVLDLGLWGPEGTRGPDAFRGWGGSRQGVLHKDQPPVFLQADQADRGFRPGPIGAGTWHVELGFGNVTSSGADYRVEVRCLAGPVGTAPVPDPVDPTHVANPEPGWYHGDFHMHGWHSNSAGPTNEEVIAHAREVGLDFLPMTEYVVPWHHDEWGTVARANPDLLVWPGREVITYSGHGIVLGETPSEIDYRHGFEDITLRSIQDRSIADGALFGVAHPTIFPSVLGDLCRGCAFELGDEIDWSRVTTLEVQTGPVAYDNSFLGGPGGGPSLESPFNGTAIDLWEDLLLAGHRITAVSGSDAKQVEGHGDSLTAVHASELSREALTEALRNQRAYVRTRGADGSPTLDFTAAAGDDEVMIGGTLVADQATLTMALTGAMGHRLDVIRNGLLIQTFLVTGDPWSMDVPAFRGPDEGPLGTFYRVDAVDPTGIRSIISNPIWLSSTAPAPTAAPTPDAAPEPSPTPTSAPVPPPDQPLPATGGGVAALALAAALGAFVFGRPQALKSRSAVVRAAAALGDGRRGPAGPMGRPRRRNQG